MTRYERNVAVLLINHAPPSAFAAIITGAPAQESDPLTPEHRAALPARIRNAEWVANRHDAFKGVTSVLLRHPAFAYVPVGAEPEIFCSMVMPVTAEPDEPSVLLARMGGTYYVLCGVEEGRVKVLTGRQAEALAHMRADFDRLPPDQADVTAYATQLRVVPCADPNLLIGGSHHSDVGPHLAVSGLTNPVLPVTDEEYAALLHAAGYPVRTVTPEQADAALRRVKANLEAQGAPAAPVDA